MLISSLVTVKIAYALAKDMVNFETAKRLAPNFLDSGKRWLWDAIQKQHRATGDEKSDAKVKRSQDSLSTEYLVYNWLEALFAWFQVVVLWHEPSVSLSAVSGLLSLFLLLTYFAPRFYATILIVIFVFNLYKFWFRHVWPEIRVPPGKDRETELKLDVDRWTYLHPQLMTLAELQNNLRNLMNSCEAHLCDLLELRQRKPVAFCSLLCSIFLCTAFMGNNFSGMCLVFSSLVVLMTGPGIYVHLLPESGRQWLRDNVGKKLFSDNKVSRFATTDAPDSTTADEIVGGHEDANSEPPTPASVAPKLRAEYIASSLSSTAISIEHLFESLKQRSFPSTRRSSSTSATILDKCDDKEEEEEKEGNEECDEKTKLIDIPLSSTRDRQRSNDYVENDNEGESLHTHEEQGSQRRRRRKGSSNLSHENDETVALLESDDEQHDGFVML